MRGLSQDMPAFGGELEFRAGDVDQIRADQFKQVDQLLSLKADGTTGFDFQQDKNKVGG